MPDMRGLAMWRTAAARSCVSREGLSATRAVHLVMSVLLLAMLAVSDKKKTESCEYDLDMASKKVKIICMGSPSMVNVYATSAVMESSSSSSSSNNNNNDNNNNNNLGENSYDKHVLNMKKNVPSFMQGQTGNTEDLPRRDSDFGQQLQPPERMTFPGSDKLSLEEELEEAADRGDSLLGYSRAFGDAVLNVTKRLREARDNLSSCGAAIRNISTWLDQGQQVLVTDNLKRIKPSVTDLKEGIIAASRSQHNFMRNILLTRTEEQRKMVEASSLLMDMTMDGLSSAVTAHKLAMQKVSNLNDLLRRLRKRLSKEITRHEHLQGHGLSSNSAGKCPKQISAIGRGSTKDMQWTSGAYMVQSGNAKEHKSIFIMADHGPSSELLEYYSSAEIDYNLVGKYFTLPFNCSGTGHVVYRRHFYCHKTDTNMIVKYNLKRSETVSELALPGARYGNTQAYTSGANLDIDLAVDELGLWAVYATDVTAGNLSIAKINHTKMEIEGTWPTTYPKRQAGNAFMICGALYATNPHSDSPTFVRYVYNTGNKKGQLLEEGVLPLANSATLGVSASGGVGHRPTNSVMLSYDFRSSSLYSWNNGTLESFPVYFRESA